MLLIRAFASIPPAAWPFSNETYHPITSDQYRMPLLGDERPFDLIFLDGLHTYSQTLRDFRASQALAHSRTVWLIDDTVPSDPIAADPDLQRVQAAPACRRPCERSDLDGGCVQGRCLIDAFCPQYTCLTSRATGRP